jgi:ribosome biogenesis GTPase A
MGYPNDSKSSTINALLQEKKISVSATLGEKQNISKHFFWRRI